MLERNTEDRNGYRCCVREISDRKIAARFPDVGFQAVRVRHGKAALATLACNPTIELVMSDIDIQKNRCRTTVASRFGETPAKTVPYRGSDRLSRPRPGRLEKTCIWG